MKARLIVFNDKNDVDNFIKKYRGYFCRYKDGKEYEYKHNDYRSTYDLRFMTDQKDWDHILSQESDNLHHRRYVMWLYRRCSDASLV